MDISGTGAITLEGFRLLVEESLTGIYLIQHDRLVYVNRRLADMFGYSRQEMLELPSLLNVIAPEDHALVAERLRQRVTGEIAAIEYTVRGVKKDGDPITLDVRSARTMHEGAPAVIGSMLDITDRKRLEDALHALTLTDDLTGLYNRRGFVTLGERHIELARRKGREMLLIFADIDGLKSINDTYGHAAGDQALVDAARLLRTTYRSADIIARLGGDEFTVFPLEANHESAEILVSRLTQNIARENAVGDRPYVLSLSVGVGRFDPVRCQTVQQVLEEADRELYERKRQR
jgi:diguanylate cyclase (GGDEF)-like protein/PAS domain S-box-containing protein